MAGPIDQFQITPIVPIEVGGLDLSFTNSSAFMLLATSSRATVPGRWQSTAEMLHDFVSKTLRDNAGQEGMRFFPLVFSLFMFVLFANLIGMFPYAFTVTSHIIVTFALAMTV